MNRIIPLLVMLFLATSILAQEKKKENPWRTLSKVTFNKEFDELMGMDIEKPVYMQPVLDLSGKEITIEGYIIPLKGKKAQSHFMLSAYPYNMCFFCGAAGPETVLQAFTKDKKEIEFSSKPVTIKGTLSLNHGDVNEMMYTLSNVELVNSK